MAKFWKNGLSFTCHQCGNCCTFEGGAVYATEQEFKKIAERLGIELARFYSDYTFMDYGKRSLKSVESGPCIFYKDGCSIYDIRPTQCRTYPFWPELLKSNYRWQQEAKSCQGINKGKFWTSEEIKIELSKNSNSD
ncbi:MAG: YkgJ family cysteine cluster protein [Calditrichaeota bacterium]|nr:YkgJ family cysteine cluster protein [Calditrichota bacterium]